MMTVDLGSDSDDEPHVQQTEWPQEDRILGELLKESPDPAIIFDLLASLSTSPDWHAYDLNIYKTTLWKHEFFREHPENVTRAVQIIYKSEVLAHLMLLQNRHKISNLGACVKSLVSEVYGPSDPYQTKDFSNNILHELACYPDMVVYIDLNHKHPLPFVNAAMYTHDSEGNTPLTIACQNANLSFVFVLIQLTAGLIRYNPHMVTELHAAVMSIYTNNPERPGIISIFKYLSQSSYFTFGKALYDMLYEDLKYKVPNLPLWFGWQVMQQGIKTATAWLPSFAAQQTSATTSPPRTAPTPDSSDFELIEKQDAAPTPSPSPPA